MYYFVITGKIILWAVWLQITYMNYMNLYGHCDKLYHVK